MKERCKNCKISRSFEDGAPGPESSLAVEQSLEYIQKLPLEDKKQLYVNEWGEIIVPASWRDDGDDLSDEEYYREIDKNHANN